MKKNWIRFLALFAWTPLILTCKPIGANSGFNFTMGQNSTIIIASTTSTCAGINSGTLDTGVAANYFQLNTMNITWTSSNPLTIQFVRLTINSPDVNNGTEYVCTLASTDLLNTWVQQWNATDPTTGLPICGSTSVAPLAVTITNTTPTTPACDVVATVNYCPFSCGAITMTNPANSSSGVVNVTVYATYNAGGGNIVPLTLEKPLSYSYTGFAQ